MTNTYTTDNSTGKRQLVTGLFPDRTSAERAYDAIAARGYSKDDINLVMSVEARKKHFSGEYSQDTELGTKAAEGAGIGGAIGGSVGAIIAAIAAVGTSIVFPGLGLVVAGPLAAGLAGAGAGGAAGGLIGALIGYGIPEERVAQYEEGIKNGGILVGVTPRNDEDAAHIEHTFTENNGEHVIGTGLGATAGALTGAAIGAAAGPIGLVAGATVGAVTGGLAGKGAAEVVNPKHSDDLHEHNLGQGVGASGGALTGTAVGAAAGGLTGQSAGAAINPAAEDNYWRETYRNEPYFNSAYTYDDYAPAYRLGYKGPSQYGSAFDNAEPRLSEEWNQVKGNSRLGWQEAKTAVRSAWQRATH